MTFIVSNRLLEIKNDFIKKEVFLETVGQLGLNGYSSPEVKSLIYNKIKEGTYLDSIKEEYCNKGKM